MANIGVLGAGKLGLPVALAIESQGHEVMVYDPNPDIEAYISGEKPYPHQEQFVDLMLEDTHIKVAKDIGELVLNSDIVFAAIQTPHEPQFEGSTRLPDERADFNYTFLKDAVKSVVDASDENDKLTTLSVISTCLPGTFEREIKPLLSENINYVYNPLYIAMGTVVNDYLDPEFVLIGQEDENAAQQLADFYSTIHDKPHVITDVTTAEGIKVSYNTWITAKTVIANAWGEMCEKLGMDFDAMYEAWSLATDRLISPKYMKAGMSDGGGCHPRDNIALSHIAKEKGMSHNIWEDLMEAREDHIQWLATTIAAKSIKLEYPVVILGRSFKPETNIETGSGAILLANMLREFGIKPNHWEDLPDGVPQKAVYFIGTQHERYKDITFPYGSVVIDPFGYIDDRDGITVVRLGRK